MTDIERRFVDMEATVTGKKLGGYAAVFDSITDLRGLFLERIAPSAFRSVLASPDLDVVALFNHEENLLLARTSNGSLRLSTDSHGLEFDMDLNLETTLGKDIRAMVDSGLIRKCSFAFRVGADDWSSHEGRDLRTINSFSELGDVSVVTKPAYNTTSVSLRSKPAASVKPSLDLRTQVARTLAQTKG